ncbi:hypothetical protein RJT34_12285 [Clitoria ternatea]|uniref:Uncharacterized protein n=1 Tax=Clitoria ternatea TaxID=43366 RepID=A0AAN9JNG7_CLITE
MTGTAILELRARIPGHLKQFPEYDILKWKHIDWIKRFYEVVGEFQSDQGSFRKKVTEKRKRNKSKFHILPSTPCFVPPMPFDQLMQYPNLISLSDIVMYYALKAEETSVQMDMQQRKQYHKFHRVVSSGKKILITPNRLHPRAV